MCVQRREAGAHRPENTNTTYKCTNKHRPTTWTLHTYTTRYVYHYIYIHIVIYALVLCEHAVACLQSCCTQLGTRVLRSVCAENEEIAHAAAAQVCSRTKRTQTHTCGNLLGYCLIACVRSHCAAPMCGGWCRWQMRFINKIMLFILLVCVCGIETEWGGIRTADSRRYLWSAVSLCDGTLARATTIGLRNRSARVSLCVCVNVPVRFACQFRLTL